MEIINRGVNPDDYRYIVMCFKCSSELRCTKEDAEPGYTPSYSSCIFCVKCPVCSTIISVYTEQKEKEQKLAGKW
jgi:hypothetical protein